MELREIAYAVLRATPRTRLHDSRATIRPLGRKTPAGRKTPREARMGPRRTLQLLLVLTALATLVLALSGVVGPA